MITRIRSSPAKNTGWSRSSSTGNTCRAIAEVVRNTLKSYSVGSIPSALWKAGRAWSRTYIVANTASRKNRTHSLFTPDSSVGSERISSANASPWRNSSLHHFSNHLKIGWNIRSGLRSRCR